MGPRVEAQTPLALFSGVATPTLRGKQWTNYRDEKPFARIGVRGRPDREEQERFENDHNPFRSRTRTRSSVYPAAPSFTMNVKRLHAGIGDVIRRNELEVQLQSPWIPQQFG